MELSGDPISPGSARGSAIVIDDAWSISSDFEIDGGEIIICDEFVGELTRFDNCSGIVSAIGGVTSHSAVFARSVEIPAVGNCPTALEEISDGDIVEIDGDTGEISVLDKSDR